MITIKKSAYTPAQGGHQEAATSSSKAKSSKSPSPAPASKGGQKQHIYYPKLYQFRVEQGLHKNEDGKLTLAQLGLENLEKCHHVSITNPTKDGPQSYRVRICKTCCNSDTHIELGTYIDQESAILVNDVHEILIGRWDKLIVLRPEDKPFLGKLYARKYDRHRGRDETNILALLTERNFGSDETTTTTKKKRTRGSSSNENDNNLDVFSDEVEASLSNLSNYGDDISMIDSIEDDGKMLLFSDGNGGGGGGGHKVSLYTDSAANPFGTLSMLKHGGIGGLGGVDNGGAIVANPGFFFGGPSEFNMGLGPDRDSELLSEFNPDFHPAGVGGKRPFGELFMNEGGIFDNNNLTSFYDMESLARSRGNSLTHSLAGSDNMRSRSGSGMEMRSRGGSHDMHMHNIGSMSSKMLEVSTQFQNQNQMLGQYGHSQFSNHDMTLLSELPNRSLPPRPLQRPRASSFGGRSEGEYLDLLNQPLTPMSTLRVFASMDDSDFYCAKSYLNQRGNDAAISTNMGPPQNVMGLSGGIARIPVGLQSASANSNSNSNNDNPFMNRNVSFDSNSSSMTLDRKDEVDNLKLPSFARSDSGDANLFRRTVSLQSPMSSSIISSSTTTNSNNVNINNSCTDKTVTSIHLNNNNDDSLDSRRSNSNNEMGIGDVGGDEDSGAIIRTKSSKDLIASLTSLKTCFKDEVYLDFDRQLPKSTRSVSSRESSTSAASAFASSYTTSDSTSTHSMQTDNSPSDTAPGRTRSYSMPALFEGMPQIPGGRLRTDSNVQEFKEMGHIGIYSPEERKIRIRKFLEKRKSRIWSQKVKYDVRKVFADSRVRVKGRFVKKEQQEQQQQGKSNSNSSSSSINSNISSSNNSSGGEGEGGSAKNASTSS